MPKVTKVYEFDEQDIRRGLLLRFEELYGSDQNVIEDDFVFELYDSVDNYPHGDFVPARIKCASITV